MNVGNAPQTLLYQQVSPSPSAKTYPSSPAARGRADAHQSARPSQRRMPQATAETRAASCAKPSASVDVATMMEAKALQQTVHMAFNEAAYKKDWSTLNQLFECSPEEANQALKAFTITHCVDSDSFNADRLDKIVELLSNVTSSAVDIGMGIPVGTTGRSINFLHLATAARNTDYIDFFIDRGVDVNCQRWQTGDHLLHLAAQLGDVRVMRHLYEKGANFTLLADGSTSVLTVAAKENNVDVARQASSWAMEKASKTADPLRAFLNYLSSEDQHGYTAFMTACANGALDVVLMMRNEIPALFAHRDIEKVIVGRLFIHEPHQNPLRLAHDAGHDHVVRGYLKNEAEIKSRRFQENDRSRQNSFQRGRESEQFVRDYFYGFAKSHKKISSTDVTSKFCQDLENKLKDEEFCRNIFQRKFIDKNLFNDVATTLKLNAAQVTPAAVENALRRELSTLASKDAETCENINEILSHMRFITESPCLSEKGKIPMRCWLLYRAYVICSQKKSIIFDGGHNAAGQYLEVKDTAKLSMTQQLRVMKRYVRYAEGQFTIATGSKTSLDTQIKKYATLHPNSYVRIDRLDFLGPE